MYVRKTDTLMNQMLDYVETMRQAAMKAHPPSTIAYGTPLFDSARDAVIKASYRDAPHLEGKLPATWLKDHRRVVIRFPLDGSDDLDRDSNVEKQDLEFPEHDTVSLPLAATYRYYGVEVDLKPDDCDDLLRSFFDVVSSRKDHRRRINKQFRAVVDQIQIFMAGYSSLNAAIKVMPEIEMYVPAAYMAKLREPAPSRAAKNSSLLPESLGIDRDMLASLAIGHRITKPQ